MPAWRDGVRRQTQRSSTQRRPVRVLHVLSTLDLGGTEQMIVNWLRSIDRTEVRFDFVVKDSAAPYRHEEEVLKLGGRVFRLPRLSLLGLPVFLMRWAWLLYLHPEWGILHLHHTSHAPLYLPIARALGRTCIVHSHSTQHRHGPKGWLQVIGDRILRILGHHFLACSTDAGKYMFGKRPFRVVPNAVDIAAYRDALQSREHMRRKLGIQDKFAVIHVGSFGRPKNHSFLIDVFREVANRDETAVLLLVGDGPLRPHIELLVNESGLASRVLFLGLRSDVAQLLAAADLFVMPSLYEGLPLAGVEAQASGLPTIFSDSVPSEVHLTDRVLSLSLDESPEVWADEAFRLSSEPVATRLSQGATLLDSEYDTQRLGHWLTGFYGGARGVRT